MAFFDWNGNGKKDLQDDYLEYKIWNDDEDDNRPKYTYTNNSSGCNFGCGFWIFIILIILAAISDWS